MVRQHHGPASFPAPSPFLPLEVSELVPPLKSPKTVRLVSFAEGVATFHQGLGKHTLLSQLVSLVPSYHKPYLENPLHGCGLLGFSFDMEPQVLGGLPFQEEGRETCECA